MLRGAIYRSRTLYNAITRLKLGADFETRYKLAAAHVRPGESVLDLCAGWGELARFLPPGASYAAVEASPEFARLLAKRGIANAPLNLHEGWPASAPKADAIVMLISLYQFRGTTLESLLEGFKASARKVVIVEDVLESERGEDSLVSRAINYLCATDYYVPMELLTRERFRALLGAHGYRVDDAGPRYAVGLWTR